MKGYVKSSPHLFRPVGRAFLLGVGALLLLSALVPAPLEPPADPGHPPNPARSAWFLLWIQELVSYGTPAIYVAVALVALLVALPWLPLRRREHASWLPREQWPVAVAVLLAAVFVLTLTVVAFFLRGPDWRLVLPF
jgi:hypothetical protein